MTINRSFSCQNHIFPESWDGIFISSLREEEIGPLILRIPHPISGSCVNFVREIQYGPFIGQAA